MCLIHQVRREGTSCATINGGAIQLNGSATILQIDSNRSVLQIILGLASQLGTDVSGIAGVVIRLVVGSRRPNKNGRYLSRLICLRMGSGSRQAIVDGGICVNNGHQGEHHGKCHAQRYKALRNGTFHFL